MYKHSTHSLVHKKILKTLQWVVSVVRQDIQDTEIRDTDTIRTNKLSITFSTFPYRVDEISRRREHLDSVVVVITDDKVTVQINAEEGTANQTLTAALSYPRFQNITFPRKKVHTIATPVQHHHVCLELV